MGGCESALQCRSKARPALQRTSKRHWQQQPHRPLQPKQQLQVRISTIGPRSVRRETENCLRWDSGVELSKAASHARVCSFYTPVSYLTRLDSSPGMMASVSAPANQAQRRGHSGRPAANGDGHRAQPAGVLSFWSKTCAHKVCIQSGRAAEWGRFCWSLCCNR